MWRLPEVSREKLGQRRLGLGGEWAAPSVGRGDRRAPSPSPGSGGWRRPPLRTEATWSGGRGSELKVHHVNQLREPGTSPLARRPLQTRGAAGPRRRLVSRLQLRTPRWYQMAAQCSAASPVPGARGAGGPAEAPLPPPAAPTGASVGPHSWARRASGLVPPAPRRPPAPSLPGLSLAPGRPPPGQALYQVSQLLTQPGWLLWLLPTFPVEPAKGARKPWQVPRGPPSPKLWPQEFLFPFVISKVWVGRSLAGLGRTLACERWLLLGRVRGPGLGF